MITRGLGSSTMIVRGMDGILSGIAISIISAGSFTLATLHSVSLFQGVSVYGVFSAGVSKLFHFLQGLAMSFSGSVGISLYRTLAQVISSVVEGSVSQSRMAYLRGVLIAHGAFSVSLTALKKIFYPLSRVGSAKMNAGILVKRMAMKIITRILKEKV